MDIEAFITWALAEQRTLEEKYTVECLVIDGLRNWHRLQKNYGYDGVEERIRLSREQSLNPAYLPDYSETDLRRATECMPAWKTWRFGFERDLRDISAMVFFPHLEELHFTFHTQVEDWTPLTFLPKLRCLHIGHPGSLHNKDTCEDFTPIAQCRTLRELAISFCDPWPDFTGIDALDDLEILHLTGNLLALPRDVTFPNVKTASLHCKPLAMRDVRDMPNLPACESLTLSGAASLRGIEKMPALHSLTLVGAFKSYEPLTAAPGLLSLIVEPESAHNLREQPFDLTPVNRIPGLLFYQFGRPYEGYDLARDYSQLTDSPTLREIFVQGCIDVATEVGTINAGFLPWDDYLLAPEPTVLPDSVLFVVAPHDRFTGIPFTGTTPAARWYASPGVRTCLSRWVNHRLSAALNLLIGHTDWGNITTSSVDHTLHITTEIESFEVLPRIPEIVETVRRFNAALAIPAKPSLWIMLRIPPPESSDALKELEKELKKRRDDWESETRDREQAEYRNKLNRLRLQEEQGTPIDPDDYSPEEHPPFPQMEDLLKEKGLLHDEDDDQEDENYLGAGLEYKNLSLIEDENVHPLADAYRLSATITSDAIHFNTHNRDIAIHLMGRQPDIDIPKPEKPKD